jgi:small subunit ribosomal protein S17e
MQLLERHGDMFTDDFEKNKEAIDKVAVLRSKRLRNEVAGYITVYLKNQINNSERGESGESAVEEVEVEETGE